MLSLILECGFLELWSWEGRYTVACSTKSLLCRWHCPRHYWTCMASAVRWKARTLFDRTSERDVVIWTAMISGSTQAKCLDKAFDLCVRMKNAGVEPNRITLVNLLPLCAAMGALDLGKWIHCYMDKEVHWLIAKGIVEEVAALVHSLPVEEQSK